MPAWDNAQLPAPPSLVVPKADFSALGDLGNAYYQGQNQQRQQAIQTAFKEGFPKDASGQPDYKAAAQKLFQLGDYAGGTQFLQLEYGMRPVPKPESPYGIGTPDQPAQPAAQRPMSPQPDAPVQQEPQGPTQAGIGPIADATVGPAQNIPPNMSTVQAVNNVNRTGQVVPPGPAGPQAQAAPASVGPQAGPQQSVSTAADALVPGPFKSKGAVWFRDYLNTEANNLRQQAQEIDQKSAAMKVKYDTKPMLDRAAQYDERAKKIDETLAAAGLETEKTYRGEEAKRGGALYNGIQGAARAYDEMRPHLDAMSSIFKDPNFYSGTGSQLNLAYKRALVALGGDPNVALPQEAIKKVLAQNILNQVNQLKSEAGAMGQGGGRIFQSQIKLMEDAAQKADNSPAALRYLTELGYRTGQHIQEVQDLADKYNGGRLDNGFNPILAKYNREHPMFSAAEMKDIRLVAPPEFTSPAQVQASGLPKGSPFKFQKPDGTFGIKYVP
jgi:hypothetical protein